MATISDTVLDRLSSIEGEAGVLGSMLLEPDCIPTVLGIVQADSFFKGEHRIIFEAIAALVEARKPVDSVALRTQLKEQGQLDEIGGVEYISRILDSVPTAANAGYYARVVGDRARFRRLVESVNVMRDALEEPGSVDEQIGQVQAIAADIEPVKLGDGIYAAKDYAIEVALGLQEKRAVISTGFVGIDRFIGGFSPGDMAIIAARPSMGKTALAVGFALNAAKAGHKVVFFTLEMTAKALMTRALCNLARVGMQEARSENPSAMVIDKLVAAANELEALPLVFHERGNTPEKLTAFVKARKKAEGVDLVIVDYVQLMSVVGKPENRVQEITTISRKLKLAAIAEQVPVIVLSQLNREVEARISHRPRMSDLRESGALEQDADIVMLLHREDYYRRNEQPDKYEKDGTSELIIAKQRNGPTGIASLVFLEDFACFADLCVGR